MSRPAYALLAHLALARHRRHSRENLAGLFWGDHSADRARACLNTTVWRLRRAIEPAGTTRGTYIGTSPSGELYFNTESHHWLDVEVFEDRLTRFLRHTGEPAEGAEIGSIENVLQLYTGDLMEAYLDDWVLGERERLRGLLMKALTKLMDCHRKQGGLEESLACAGQILARDPLREDVHQAIMRMYLADGRRALAASQYARCSETLRSLLGVPPMDETRRLYVEAVQGDDGASTNRPSTAVELEYLLGHLESAIEGIRSAGDQLEAAARLIRRSSTGRSVGRPGRLSGVINAAGDPPNEKILMR